MIKLKKTYPFVLALGMAVILASCTKTQINFGGEFLNNSYTNIVYVDSFVPAWSTLYRDSFATSGTGSLLAGRYTDPYFGKITAATAFHIAPPALFDIANTASFDSLTLVIKPNKSFYGDTTQAVRYNIYQLQEKLFYYEGNTAIYNNRQPFYNPVPLGTRSMTIEPRITDSIEIRLADETGQELFTKFREKADEMKNTDDFINYFKGIYIAPDPASTAVMYGFADGTAKLKLYYHQSNLFNQEKNINFFITQSQYQFNQIITDRTGTAIESLNAAKPELSSESTGGDAFLQPATGFFTKVSFPTIRNLLYRTDYQKLMKAQLIIKPSQQSYTPFFELPPQINLYTTNVSNLQGPALSSETGSLVTDYLQRENTYYTFDVTAFLLGQISITSQNENGLILNVPAGTRVFDRAVIKDSHPGDGKSFLKLYYLSIKPTNH